MPIYEYACESCGHQQEALQSVKDVPLTDCDECHKPTLKRLISAAGFRLKGSGWYETDFKTSDKKKNLSHETKTNETANTKETTVQDKPQVDTGTSAESKSVNTKESHRE